MKCLMECGESTLAGRLNRKSEHAVRRCAFGVLALLLLCDLVPNPAFASDELNTAVTRTRECLPLKNRVTTRFELPEKSGSGTPLRVYVSSGGSDASAGTAKHPFETLERCRDEIRALKQRGGIPSGGVRVVIREGIYPVTKPLALTSEDSGSPTAPIVYEAVVGEKPVFRGGKRIAKWHRLTDAGAYSLLPRESRDKVWIADLHASGIEGVLPLNLGGFGGGDGFKPHPTNELFFNGRAMQLARGPNDGFLHIKDVEVDDGAKIGRKSGGATGHFYYDGDMPGKWVNEPDLLLYGYWGVDWADSYQHVESIDPARHLISLSKPWCEYGYKAGARYYAVNALSELDVPGEWYLDRAKNVVLFYAPSNPNRAVVELSENAEPFVKLDHVSNVRFVGIAWDLGSGEGVQVNGGDHVVFVGCGIHRFACDGFEMRGARDSGLLSCDISSMGRGGVAIVSGDRKTLEAGDDFVANCDIHGLSRINHTYTPAILLQGVGNRIVHNRLHDCPSSAMRVAGNDEIVEYNEVFNVVTESDDQGGADMWGDPTYRGNIYRFNYWHHIGNGRTSGTGTECGQAGVRLDDAISGTVIFGNVFERCAEARFGAVQMNGGRDNTIENNLFIDCAGCVSGGPWDGDHWQKFVPKRLGELGIDLELYKNRYPKLSGLLDPTGSDLIRHNLTLRCGTFLHNAAKADEATDNDGKLDAGFSMKTAPAVFKAPGIDPIPLGEIGLYRDAWRKVDPAP